MTARIALRALLSLCVFVAACGNDGSAGSAAPDTGPIGDDSDSSTATDASSMTCETDALGETSQEDPMVLESGDALDGLTLCAENERDWFAFDARAGDVLRWRLETDQPLRVAVAFGSADSELRYADASEVEEAAITITESGLSLVSVQAFETVPATYSISLDVTPAPACQNESTEPNDSLVEGTPLQPGDQRSGTICAGDVDWYAIPLVEGEALSVVLEADFAAGDLDFSVVDSSGDVLANASTTADVEQIQLEPPGEQTVYARVFAFDEDTRNTYRIRAATFLDAHITTAELSGSVTYEDRPYGAEGFTGELVPTPSNGVTVQVVNETSEAVVAETTTDEGGSWRVQVTSDARAPHRVRVLSVGEFEGQRVEVRDRTRSEALYAMSTEPFTLGDRSFELVARADTPLGGAFNIVDVTLEAFEFVAPYTDRNSPTLTYSWQSGLAWPCGSCYSRNTVSLGGQLEDTDEYDDDIIIHEWAHYWVQYYSDDDSPGGPHRDRQVSPTLAYGEGVAYFIPCMIRNNPEIVDTFIDDVRYIQVEEMTIGFESVDDFFGTTNDEEDGGLREEIITGIMWDAYDDENEEHDNLSIGVEGTMSILMSVLVDESRSNVGARGIDLADWLDALTCEIGGDASDAQALADEREFPFDVAADGLCAEKYRPHRPTLLASNHGVLAFGEQSIGAGVVAWRDGDGEWNEAPVACDASVCELPVEAASDRTVLLRAGRHSASWVGADAARMMLGGIGTFPSAYGPVREYRP